MGRSRGAFIVAAAKLYRWHKTNRFQGSHCLSVLAFKPALGHSKIFFSFFSFFLVLLSIVKVTNLSSIRSKIQLLSLRLELMTSS